MTPEEFRKQGHAIADWIADYRRDVAEFPFLSEEELASNMLVPMVAYAAADQKEK